MSILPAVALFALAAMTLAASPLLAQGLFGKNKVQYQDFDWRVLESEHFDLYYYPEEEELARTALVMAEASYDTISARLRHEVARRIPLIIYSSHQDFEQTNVTPYFLPEGVGGFTEFLKGRVALPFNGSYHDFQHVIQHELVHVFQLSRLGLSFRLHYRGDPVGPPLWFTEGMADHWSETWDATAELFMRDLVLGDLLPPIPDLWRYNGTFVIYKIGQDLVGFLERSFGPGIVPDIYDALWRAQTFEEALESATGIPLEELDARWKYDLARRYYPEVEDAAPLALAARPLAVEGGANFKGVIPPPDGALPRDRFYFLSPRTGFTNIYAASLEGRERKVEEIVQGERTAEFEAFHPFQSRMDIDRAGRLAFVSKFHERDGLFLYDLRGERLVGRWRFEDLVALRSPTFRPDGGAVIFSGLSRAGRQDLYLFEFASETLRPLTRDLYLDDDPAWSPDGRTVIFSSDRIAEGMEGARNLFILDLGTGALRPFTSGRWVDRSPAWNDAGDRLVFSSDRSGTPQLHVADLEGEVVQVTAILGGAFDPVWIPGDREVLFTAFAGQRFGIHRADLPARRAIPEPGPAPLIAASGIADPAPWDEATLSGSPDSAPRADTLTFRERPYRSRFTLDFAQGAVAFEPSQNVGEGLAGVLTDQLGDRLIYVQMSNTAEQFDEFLGRLSLGFTYLDLSRRLNRGFSLFHYAGDFRDELGNRYFERRVGGALIASYPYSKFFRVESTLGLLYSDREADSFRPAREGFLAVNYLSFIRDTSLWFSTGPMDGARYNLTLGLTTNIEKAEIENVAALVDLRRYFRTSLRTSYALRLQARVSQGSLPDRFTLGGSWSLRGYPRRELVGTRAVMVNQEWRFPLLQGAALGFPFGTIGLPGVQGALFLDAAQAWEEEQSPEGVVGSFGLGLRSSLFGFLVLRLDLSRRTDFARVEDGTEVDFFVGYNY